jgi:hypothetical protein
MAMQTPALEVWHAKQRLFTLHVTEATMAIGWNERFQTLRSEMLAGTSSAPMLALRALCEEFAKVCNVPHSLTHSLMHHILTQT